MNPIIDLFRSKKSQPMMHTDANVPIAVCSMEKPHTRFPHQHSRSSQTPKPGEKQSKYTQFTHRQERQRVASTHKDADKPNELMAPNSDTEADQPTAPVAKTPAKPHSVPIDVLRKALPGRCNVQSPETVPTSASIHQAFDEDQDD